MKQTEIYYRKISPNVIKITDIKNALSLSKIRMQFGDDVTEEYRKGARYYMPHDVLYVKKETFERQITVDSVTTKQDFTNIISIMKEAGERLRQIIAEKKIVENWGKQKSEQIKSTEEQIYDMIKRLSFGALLRIRNKLAVEIQRRTKTELVIKERFPLFIIHDDLSLEIKKDLPEIDKKSFKEIVLNTLRKNSYQGDNKKEKDIIKPDCFGTDKEAEECCHCKYFTECGRVYRKDIRKSKEVKTIKI
jgi:fructose-1,6-bisphosphatase